VYVEPSQGSVNTKPEHRPGLHFFWRRGHIIGEDWTTLQFDDAIKIGPSYLREIHLVQRVVQVSDSEYRPVVVCEGDARSLGRHDLRQHECATIKRILVQIEVGVAMWPDWLEVQLLRILVISLLCFLVKIWSIVWYPRLQ
jgi:hypothetical protein